jgi:hypothetical protein
MSNQSTTNVFIFSDNNKSVFLISLLVYYIFSELLINNISDRIIDKEYQRILVNKLEKED